MVKPYHGADAMAADALLGHKMDGPLPVGHGAPVRLVVPGWYGICKVKWLMRIELSTDHLMARFMGRDYVTIQGREVDGHTEWVETSVTKQRIKSVNRIGSEAHPLGEQRAVDADDHGRLIGVPNYPAGGLAYQLAPPVLLLPFGSEAVYCPLSDRSSAKARPR